MSVAVHQTVEELLRERMKSCGLSTYRLARAIGVTEPSLWRFVKGKQDALCLRTVQALFDYFGLELRPIEAPTKEAS